MSKAKFDDEHLQKIRELEELVAIESKQKVKTINAWRFLILWLSSFTKDIQPGKGDAHFSLTKQQSAEFAYSYNADLYPDVLVFLAQGQMYECLKDVGLESFEVRDDGVVLRIKDFDVDGLYIAGLTLKVPVPHSLESRLKNLKRYCQVAQLGKITPSYNTSTNRMVWNITEIHNETYKIRTQF